MTEAEADVRELIDRQRIWECLLRYTRGMDRLDRDLALSAYHPDAMEDHGGFIAPCAVFVDQVLGFHREREIATQHILSNHQCEIDGDVAHAETYVGCYSVGANGKDSYGFGRFIDRLEKRDGRWALVDRVCTHEGMADLVRNQAEANFAPLPQSLSRQTRDRSDPVYRRPLRIARG
jgi:hypothetical protein